MVYCEIKNKRSFNFMPQNKETTIVATDIRILSHLLRQDFLASIPHSNFTYALPVFPTFPQPLGLTSWWLELLRTMGLGLVMTIAKVDAAPRESSRGSAKFFSPLHKRFEAFLGVLHFISKSPATMH